MEDALPNILLLRRILLLSKIILFPRILLPAKILLKPLRTTSHFGKISRRRCCSRYRHRHQRRDTGVNRSRDGPLSISAERGKLGASAFTHLYELEDCLVLQETGRPRSGDRRV